MYRRVAALRGRTHRPQRASEAPTYTHEIDVPDGQVTGVTLAVTHVVQLDSACFPHLYSFFDSHVNRPGHNLGFQLMYWLEIIQVPVIGTA